MGRRKGDGEIQHSPETWLKAWENRGLFYTIANRFFPQCDHDEFLFDGLKGLCLAIERHDPSKGKLSTLATPHIRNLMRRAIAERRSPIHIPAHVRESCDYSAISILREGETWRWDHHASPDPREELDTVSHAREITEAALKAIPPDLASIIRRRFGIGGGEPETLNEIAKETGVNRETIRQRQLEGMGLIKDYIDRRGLASPSG